LYIVFSHVFCHYFFSNNKSSLHQQFSVTKSFTSALIGIAIDEGYLNLNDTVLDFFSNREIDNWDDRKLNITIEHLLSMNSGFEWNEAINDALWFNSDDQIQYILDRPIADNPGSKFNYNSGNAHLLSAILQNVTGVSTLDFALEKIFIPIGITSYTWDSDPQGIYYGGHGLSITTREMAKFGFLYLNNGSWEGEQIVPSEWVKLSTSYQINIDSNNDYGYLWWIFPSLETYYASGFLSQLIFNFHQYDLLVVFTARIINYYILVDFLKHYILPSLEEYPNYTPSITSTSSLQPIIILVSILVLLSNKKKIKR
ncbi:MAG: serine hydrolase domain-containing protein, partial [Candidatus Thorarchaeota archaeon]